VSATAELGDALSALSTLIAEGMARRRAVEIVSALTGLPRNRLYRASL
jgi:hypothetical protein